MSGGHALAFVNYRYFRTSPETRQRFSRAYYYVSRKLRAEKLVRDGGTLWVVTSAPMDAGRIYSLAYKLVQCRSFDVWENLRPIFGRFGVIGDPTLSRHYPRNDMSDLLLSLEFSPPKPIHSREVIGLSLMTARSLSPTDVIKLTEYGDKVLHGRHVFLSYSSQDSACADALEAALTAAHVKVWRDVRSIVGGEAWEPAIERAIHNADAVLVLVSEHSRTSEYVQYEVSTALDLLDVPGKLQRIIPVVLSGDAWSEWDALHRFQKYEWAAAAVEDFKQVVTDLRTLNVRTTGAF